MTSEEKWCGHPRLPGETGNACNACEAARADPPEPEEQKAARELAEKLHAANMAVTSAIIQAEAADKQAAKAWTAVQRCEEVLVALLPPGLERDIAVGGAAVAEYKERIRRRR